MRYGVNGRPRTVRKLVRFAVVPTAVLLCLGIATESTAARASSPVVVSTTLGSLPFFATISIGNVDPSQVTSVGFTLQPRRNSTAAAISATYGRTYLSDQGLLNPVARTVAVPIFGLYDNYTNSVTLRVSTSSRSSSVTTKVRTAAWTDTWASAYQNPVVNVPRQSRVRLSYSYFMLKSWATDAGPIIVDVDGYVRWAGSFGSGSIASSLWNNEIWIGELYTGNVYAESLTGTSPRLVADLSVAPYRVNNFHHNMDLTAKGMLIDVDTTSTIESVIEVLDAQGHVTKTFDMGQILGDYLISHGEDPSGWVSSSNDWFHNNAATYWPSRNELVVSSRENFVIGINYDTLAIDWILGDTTKEWYVSYPSLRSLALGLRGGALAPIGQHAVSIDAAGNLMLFNNGMYGFFTDPAGQSRGFSLASSYAIDLTAMTATAVWNYDHGGDIFSPICSSVYQDEAGSILVNFAASPDGPRVIGLATPGTNQVAFDYSFGGVSHGGDVAMGWNAMVVHLEGLVF